LVRFGGGLIGFWGEKPEITMAARKKKAGRFSGCLKNGRPFFPGMGDFGFFSSSPI
jgi:hypothetical protein